MIVQETGKIGDDLYVIGVPATPVYLLDGPEPVIFDGGLSAFAHIYKSGIKKILGERKPAYLFLTHSHFDHIGSVSHFKELWPNLKVGGSERCGEILLKPKAIKLIQDLNLEGTKNVKKAGFEPVNETPFESFKLDIIIKPDQEINLSDNLKISAFSTPGHTWDFISYWVEEKKILIASEAVATYERGYLQPEFLVDFDAYLESMEKIKNLDATILCGGHHAVFTDDDAVNHILGSVKAAHEYLSMTEEFLVEEEGDIKRAVSRVKAAEWDPRPWPKQPESAYLLNTWERVKTISKRMNNL